jgi:hypothetical protein
MVDKTSARFTGLRKSLRIRTSINPELKLSLSLDLPGGPQNLVSKLEDLSDFLSL